MEVTLAQGNVVYAGTDGPPPDLPHLGTQGHIYKYDAYSSDDSSEDDRPERREKRCERRERKMQKKEQRRERKGLRREQKDARHERWRLVVSYREVLL